MKAYKHALIVEPAESDQNQPVIKEEESQFEHIWDQAYKMKEDLGDLDIEPDSDYRYSFGESKKNFLQTRGLGSSEADYDQDWSYPELNNVAIPKVWHLEDAFSQLASAREEVKDSNFTIRIAHFDTGYDEEHTTFPREWIRKDLERNFAKDEQDTMQDASDQGDGGILNQPGHGTATLALLAGKKGYIKNLGEFQDFGLKYQVEIVPIRIARSVLLFKTGAFVDALKYITSLYDEPNTRCHIITMSMGGLASKAWAKAVNAAYEKGIFMVTAAGNNHGNRSFSSLVYPARFHRVVAACGVTHDFSPYEKKGLEDPLEMRGNFGPKKLMRTAMAAFTPNVPWARMEEGNLVSLRGAGTSAATPQIAAAAALYYQKYHQELEALPEPWMKVEAIRHALFSSAAKTINYDRDADVKKYFGNGILKAKDALAIVPPAPDQLKKEKVDNALFSFIKILFGFKIGSRKSAPRMDEGTRSLPNEEMLELEMAQLIQINPDLQEILEGGTKEMEDLDEAEQIAFLKKVCEIPETSNTLKKIIESYLD